MPGDGAIPQSYNLIKTLRRYVAPIQNRDAPSAAATADTPRATAPTSTRAPPRADDSSFLLLELEPPTGPVRKKLPAIGGPRSSAFANVRTSKPVTGDDALTKRVTAAANVAGSSNKSSVYLQAYARSRVSFLFVGARRRDGEQELTCADLNQPGAPG